MRITRRHLLALSAAAAAVGAIGAGGLGYRWWDQSPGAALQALSEEEAQIVRAIAGTAYPRTAAIPLDGAEAHLDRFFDATLSHMPESPRKLLKLLLHGLDGGTVLTHGAPFTALTPADRSEVLKGWVQHELAELRNAAQSLVLLLGMGWTIHPEVAPTMQRYHSCGYGA
jgi:hypothetical protein